MFALPHLLEDYAAGNFVVVVVSKAQHLRTMDAQGPEQYTYLTLKLKLPRTLPNRGRQTAMGEGSLQFGSGYLNQHNLLSAGQLFR